MKRVLGEGVWVEGVLMKRVLGELMKWKVEGELMKWKVEGELMKRVLMKTVLGEGVWVEGVGKVGKK